MEEGDLRSSEEDRFSSRSPGSPEERRLDGGSESSWVASVAGTHSEQDDDSSVASASPSDATWSEEESDSPPEEEFESDSDLEEEEEEEELSEDDAGRERSQSTGSENSIFDGVLIKQLLMHLAQDLPDPPPQIERENWNRDEDVVRRALLIYKSFLAEMVHSGTSLQTVAGLSKDMITLFYGEIDDEPRFLSFTSGGDLGKLVKLLNIDLVVFSLSSGGNNPRKIHDSRLLSHMGREADEDRVRYFLLSRRAGMPHVLEPVSPAPPPERYAARLSESFFIGHALKKASDMGGCFAAALLGLLSYEPYTGPRCSDLRDLCYHVTTREWNSLPEVRRALGERRVALSFHAGSKFGSSKSSFTPENQSFQLLATFPRLLEAPDHVEVVPVCAVYPDYLYRPRDPYAEAVVRGSRFGSSNPLGVRQAAKILRSEPRGRQRQEEEEEELRHCPCACDMCRQSESLRANFRPREGQKVTQPVSSRPFHLHVFSLFSPCAVILPPRTTWRCWDWRARTT